ncbi:hypothetical protein GALMADRAFT_79410, partial [Galerina marginata CBS 339.88]
DIVDGKFRQVLVSPEIATSAEFQKAVLSKDPFIRNLRAVNIDEAHCMNVWGGSFRPDYATLGILRGRFPRNVPFLVASATLPEHVLDDIRSKLKLAKDVEMVQLTNARPNVALSVRVMEHSDDSKGDLRFLIPPQAKQITDVPVSLVYCNQRTTTEDCADRGKEWADEHGLPTSCIAFYHALIGQERKHEIEEELRAGNIRILFCTEALGMGCDLRNIARVILWGLPPTFCALVQRAGRAGRDLSTLGEAILIVPKSVVKDGASKDDVSETVAEATIDGEALNREPEEVELTDTVVQALDEQGIRIAGDEDSSEEQPGTEKVKRTKKFGKDTNIREARALSKYVTTTGCRRKVWDDFFENNKKSQLEYGVNTSFKLIEGMRCCDNCTPRLFPVEKVTVKAVIPGLRRGKKKAVSEEEEKHVREELENWRDETLVDAYYGSLTSLSGATIIGDDIIEKLATCGERLESYSQVQRHVRWAMGYNQTSNTVTRWGQMLVEKLGDIYMVLDGMEAAEEQARYKENTEKEFVNMTAANFE